MWVCVRCDNDSDESFEVCWACGASRDGAPGAEFLSADEVRPISAPALTEASGAELVECYRARSELEASFVADRLLEIDVSAVLQSTRSAYGTYVSDAPRVCVRPEELAKAREWVEGYETRLRERRKLAAPPTPEVSNEAFEPLPGRGDDLVECYEARNALEAAHIAEELNEQGIPAVSDLNDLHRSIGNLQASPRVRVRARDLAPARKWVEAYDLSRAPRD